MSSFHSFLAIGLSALGIAFAPAAIGSLGGAIHNDQPTSATATAADKQPQDKPEANSDVAKVRSELVAKTNQFRASVGRSAVKENEQLNAESQKWADSLAASGKFYHDPNLSVPNNLCASENIAITTGDPLSAVGQWENSQGHRRSMESPRGLEVGHGVATMQHGSFKGQPVVVQRFANKCS